MMKLGAQTGSLVNHLYSRSAGQPEPKVGMGCTILSWTDRHAGTIVQVEENRFVVQEDHAERADSNGMSDAQEYRYQPNPRGRTWAIKRVSRGNAAGQWRESGRKDGNGVILDLRDKHHDFSF